MLKYVESVNYLDGVIVKDETFTGPAVNHLMKLLKIKSNIKPIINSLQH